MNYKYRCGNEIIRVWVWSDDYHTSVSVADTKTNRQYERTIREDENGKFFTWNKNKIYLNDWIRISMHELKEKIEQDEWCTSDELCQAILTDGTDNVRFIVPLNTTSMCIFGISLADGMKFKNTLCRIHEGYLHKITANYKISLIPVEPAEDIVSHREFYTSDMLSLIKSGHIKIVA